MRIRIHNRAKRESEAAASWYAAQQPGLEFEFSNELNRTIELISLDPESWPPYGLENRSCLLRKFPFQVIFRWESGELRIFAVAHTSRRPGYWRNREFD